MWPLKARVQNYAWGKVGLSSMVAQLKEASDSGSVDAKTPYAEYWFGTHPNGPSSIQLKPGDDADATVDLKTWLASNPAVMGGAATKDGSLPYLFKVLSIAKALSIQAHPNKSLAEELHKARPDVYKDDNHKPEMACALTKFEAMCGFRDAASIAGFLDTVPELASLVGATASSAFKAAVADGGEDGVRAALQAVFTAYATADAAAIESSVSTLTSRLEGEAGSGGEAALSAPHNFVLRLTQQFPGDVGVFAPYLLNTVTLQPGEAIFLAANEPHAYLDGDIVEVMACSDNVVRAGLTPKLRDVKTLCSMLTYRTGAPDVLTGDAIDKHTVEYKPPIPEFLLQRVELPAGATHALGPAPSACILLTLSGTGTATAATAAAGSAAAGDAAGGGGAGGGAGAGGDAAGTGESSQVSKGSVFVQHAGATVTLQSDSKSSEPLVLFRVHVNGSTD